MRATLSTPMNSMSPSSRLRCRHNRKPKHTASHMMRIGALRVDMTALSQLVHRCRPGCCGTAGCCSKYEVCINSAELSRIVGFLPSAARFCPHLKLPHGFDNIFEDLGGGIYALETDDDGLCLLAYKHRRSFKCSLHTVAEQCGLHPYQVKPHACVLWPLALTSSRAKILTVDETAYNFPCSTRQPINSPLCTSVIDTIECLFGSATLRRLRYPTPAP